MIHEGNRECFIFLFSWETVFASLNGRRLPHLYLRFYRSEVVWLHVFAMKAPPEPFLRNHVHVLHMNGPKQGCLEHLSPARMMHPCHRYAHTSWTGHTQCWSLWSLEGVLLPPVFHLCWKEAELSYSEVSGRHEDLFWCYVKDTKQWKDPMDIHVKFIFLFLHQSWIFISHFRIEISVQFLHNELKITLCLVHILLSDWTEYDLRRKYLGQSKNNILQPFKNHFLKNKQKIQSQEEESKIRLAWEM